MGHSVGGLACIRSHFDFTSFEIVHKRCEEKGVMSLCTMSKHPMNMGLCFLLTFPHHNKGCCDIRPLVFSDYFFGDGRYP